MAPRLLRLLVVSWCALGVGLATVLLNPAWQWWVFGLALLVFPQRWNRRILEAERQVSVVASSLHSFSLVLGCIVVIILGVVEWIYGRHSPIFGALGKIGAGVVFGLYTIGDGILIQALRKQRSGNAGGIEGT